MGADGKAVSTADYALNIADENALSTIVVLFQTVLTVRKLPLMF